MGKRSDFPRRERDFYPTPIEAVRPLVPHLPNVFTYWEPCAGRWHMVINIFSLTAAKCAGASDIVSVGSDEPRDAATFDYSGDFDFFITNPPWPQRGGEPTISIALNLSDQAPTWLLLSADFAHNRYFSKIANRCAKIVSVGRVSWEQNGISGKDNCAWYLFDTAHNGPIEFVPRSTA